MKLYFRVDTNKEIATGHLMRCLSIADAASKIGIDAVFIMADEQGRSIVARRGYDCIALGTKWDDPEGELVTFIKLIRELGVQNLVVDSYRVTEWYLSELSRVTSVAYIDDLNAFKYSVDVLICYANYYAKFQYEQRYPNIKLLLGTGYVPLRNEFIGLPKKTIKSKPEKIMILSGGSDNCHAVSSLVEAIYSSGYKQIDAICGMYNEDYDDLMKRYDGSAVVNIHRTLPNVADYMKDSDIVISAGGTTLYELCACGTPTISYAFADNQISNVEKFDEDGIIRYAGDARYTDIVPAVQRLLLEYENCEYRQILSEKMQELVDGKGAERVVRALIAYGDKQHEEVYRYILPREVDV